MSEYDSVEENLTPQEQTLLKRLKLVSFAMVVLIIVHGLPSMYAEMYPMTRWGMFSASDTGSRGWVEGDWFTYEMVVTYVDGQVETFNNYDLYANLQTNAAKSSMAAATMAYSAEHEDQATRLDNATKLFEWAEELGGKVPDSIEIWRLRHPIDYENFPPVDFENAASRERIGFLRLLGDNTIEGIE